MFGKEECLTRIVSKWQAIVAGVNNSEIYTQVKMESQIFLYLIMY